MKPDAAYWIKTLNLQPHPEGGFYAETYRASGNIPSAILPGFMGERAYSTAIYFLLSGNDFSAFHRIRSDEIWHFYAGSEVLIHALTPKKDYHRVCLGNGALENARPQCIIPAGTWFAAELIDKQSFALVGCTVSPGFDFSDFEMGEREKLLKDYPAHGVIIQSLTRIL